MSKSPKAVLLAALATAREALPLYSHRHSPKKFTQHQLFACLVLKCFLKTDYRGVVAHLADCPSLAAAIELGHIPHYTTLQKAARRLLAAAPARRLLDATVREQLGRKQRVSRSAIDSTGLEATAARATSFDAATAWEPLGKPYCTIAFRNSAWSATSKRTSFSRRRMGKAPSLTSLTFGRW